MLGERIASQPEVIRAIVSGYGLCCGVPHQTPVTAVGIRCRPGARAQLRHGRLKNHETESSGIERGHGRLKNHETESSGIESLCSPCGRGGAGM